MTTHHEEEEPVETHPSTTREAVEQLNATDLLIYGNREEREGLKRMEAMFLSGVERAETDGARRHYQRKLDILRGVSS